MFNETLDLYKMIKDIFYLYFNFLNGKGYNNSMTSASVTGITKNNNGLRPLNILKDLPKVADLVEECFKGSLDNEGQAAIETFRRRGADRKFLSWAPKVIDSLSMPLTGFVWEEDGALIGNASLIPYYYEQRKVYLLANVATLPKYEGRGIASALTKAAVTYALEKGCDSIWLQVRSDNHRAIDLYERIGFIRKYERTTWQLPIGHRFIPPKASSGVTLIKSMGVDWNELRELYLKGHPKELSWFNQFDVDHIKPGFIQSLGRLLRDERVIQKSAFVGGKLCGGVALINRFGAHELLILSMREDKTALLLPELLLSMAEKFTKHKKLTFEMQPGDQDQMIFDMGFTPKRVLLWMKYIGN